MTTIGNHWQVAELLARMRGSLATLNELRDKRPLRGDNKVRAVALVKEIRAMKLDVMKIQARINTRNRNVRE